MNHHQPLIHSYNNQGSWSNSVSLLNQPLQVDSMAGMTSQPSMGAMVACTKGTELDTGKQQVLQTACFNNQCK